MINLLERFMFMRISIALTTYNGEKYLYQLLRFLYEQTRTPDEVIICDDCSVDNTVDIIDKFIIGRGLKQKWHIYVNEKNLGFKIFFKGNVLYKM